MSTLAQRVNAASKARGISITKAEENAGLVSAGYFHRIAKGERTSLGPKIMRQLADAFRVSYEWMASGRGAMGTVEEWEKSRAGGPKERVMESDVYESASDAVKVEFDRREDPSLDQDKWMDVLRALVTLDKNGMLVPGLGGVPVKRAMPGNGRAVRLLGPGERPQADGTQIHRATAQRQQPRATKAKR